MPRIAWPHLPLAVAGFVLASTGYLRPALGESPATDARRLFEAGANAYANGQHEQAISAFYEAYSRTRRPGLLFSLAQAHRGAYENTRTATHRQAAVEYYSRYLREAPAGRHLDVAKQRLQELQVEEKLDASASPAEASSSSSEAPPPKPVTTRPDSLVPLAPKGRATPRQIAGWALLGSGAATLLAGGTLGYLALRRDAEATRLDQQEPDNARDYNATARSRDDFRLAAIITASAGAAATVTGVLTLLLDSTGTVRSGAPQPRGALRREATVNSWRPAALLNSEGFRLQLSTTF